MNCPNCNADLPDTATMCYICKYTIKKEAESDKKICPNCGAPLPNTATMCYSCKYQFTHQTIVQQQEPQYTPITPVYNYSGMACRRCRGHNVEIVYNRYQKAAKGKAQVKKKSLARRGLEKEGRHMANLLTMGAYGVFSKKPSKYVEVSKDKYKTKTEKVAVCQDCGYSWKV